jgi:hypothetical protein
MAFPAPTLRDVARQMLSDDMLDNLLQTVEAELLVKIVRPDVIGFSQAFEVQIKSGMAVQVRIPDQFVYDDRRGGALSGNCDVVTCDAENLADDPVNQPF